MAAPHVAQPAFDPISHDGVSHLAADSKADAARHSARIAARYQAITEGAAAGILRIDGRGRIIEVNRFACALLGYDGGELRGQNVRVLMPEPCRSAHDGYLEAYQRTGLARVIGKGTEVDALHREYGITHIDMPATPETVWSAIQSARNAA